jgi:glucose/mannose transport system substrate-binding protein
LALFSAWLGGCDGGEDSAKARAPIEVFSWGGLQDSLVVEHERRHPQDRIIHANAQLSATARKTLRERMLAGDPPDSFQVNAGLDLLQWVLFNKSDARDSRLQALDALPAMQDLKDAWPPPLRDALSHGGHVYAVPANVHRINEMFFNPEVLRDVQAEPPRRLEDLLVIGEALRRKGIPLLAIGAQDPWALSVLIIESLLISQHGPDFYESYFSGKLSADDPRISQTLAMALRLLEYANPDRGSMHWEQAAEMVLNGRAAMTVMGDWARTLFDAPGANLEHRYREMTFPGTESVFVFACNVFPLPVGAKNDAGARRLLATIGSLEGQASVGQSRTSIPARLDVDAAAPDPLQAQKRTLWRTGRLVMAQSGLVPPQFANDLNEALVALDEERRPSPVLHTLRARYVLLGR